MSSTSQSGSLLRTFKVARVCAGHPPGPRAAVALQRPELFPFTISVNMLPAPYPCRHCGEVMYLVHNKSASAVDRKFGLEPVKVRRYVCATMEQGFRPVKNT